jgi:hypothetical protein
MPTHSLAKTRPVSHISVGGGLNKLELRLLKMPTDAYAYARQLL